MALELPRTEKGIPCRYWTIIQTQTDRTTNTTRSILGLYVDREHRLNDIKAFLYRHAMDMQGVGLSLAEQYAEWTKSRMKQQPKTENGDMVRDKDGKPIMEQVESNLFVSALPILEPGQSIPK